VTALHQFAGDKDIEQRTVRPRPVLEGV
jgi:hypothetical protein